MSAEKSRFAVLRKAAPVAIAAGLAFPSPALADAAHVDPQKPPKGYYELQVPADGSIVFRDPQCRIEHWGKKVVVDTIKEVAKDWKKEYPQGYLMVEDLNGPTIEHQLHHNGVDVDVFATTGTVWAANHDGRERHLKGNKYSEKATIELLKMFADKLPIDIIYHDDEGVQEALDGYKGMSVKIIGGHDKHAHLRFGADELTFWAPHGPKKDCHPEKIYPQ